jgi:hypothetical protein
MSVHVPEAKVEGKLDRRSRKVADHFDTLVIYGRIKAYSRTTGGYWAVQLAGGKWVSLGTVTSAEAFLLGALRTGRQP